MLPHAALSSLAYTSYPTHTSVYVDSPREEDIEVRLSDWHMLDGVEKGLELAHGVHLWL